MKSSRSILQVILFTSAISITHVAGAEVAVIVNPKSNTARMTADQVSAIFLGKTQSLPGGGAAQPVDLPEGDSVRNQFYSKVTGKNASQLRSYWSQIVFSGKGKPPKTLGSATEVKRFVATNPNAISYIEKSAVDASVKVILVVD